jgi:hypothetical protein
MITILACYFDTSRACVEHDGGYLTCMDAIKQNSDIDKELIV